MEPLAWYISGPLIGAIVPILLVLTGKQLGVSSSFRVLGSFTLPKREYFNYAYQNDRWQVYFVLGVIAASVVLFQTTNIGIPPQSAAGKLSESFYELKNLPFFFVGGVLTGFGARYANGCTAGHCIMGNAQFAPSSLVTTIGFFAGGLIAAHILIPLIVFS